jgi:hypothetical protein
MVNIRLERLFDDPDFPSLKMAALVGSVSDYQQIVEEFIPMARDQLTVRFRARNRRDHPNLDEEDLKEEYELHDWVVSGLVPGFLGGSVLVALWAAFEQSIGATTKYIKGKENAPLTFEELREHDVCSRFVKYLGVLTKTTFAFPHQLSDIQSLRNLYAHHNGSVEHLSERKHTQVKEIVRTSNGRMSFYDKHHVVLSPEYLKDALQRVDSCLEAVITFLDHRYPHDEKK